MALTIDLPSDIEANLRKRWSDLPRHALEALAVEGYRARVLSRAEVRRMLGFETREQVDAYMAKAGVPFDYSIEDFEHDAATSEHLQELRRR
jgi:hypothetical protein